MSEVSLDGAAVADDDAIEGEVLPFPDLIGGPGPSVARAAAAPDRAGAPAHPDGTRQGRTLALAPRPAPRAVPPRPRPGPRPGHRLVGGRRPNPHRLCTGQLVVAGGTDLPAAQGGSGRGRREVPRPSQARPGSPDGPRLRPARRGGRRSAWRRAWLSSVSPLLWIPVGAVGVPVLAGIGRPDEQADSDQRRRPGRRRAAHCRGDRPRARGARHRGDEQGAAGERRQGHRDARRADAGRPRLAWRGDLPHGVTAGEVGEKREKLASGLRRPIGCVWPETDHKRHPGRSTCASPTRT